MSRLPIPHIINTIKTKLGFDRALTASGEDVVDAINKQSRQIGALQNTDSAIESGLAMIVDGDSVAQTVNKGQYVYIKNNTHGLTNGLYLAKAAFPTGGQTPADSTYFDAAEDILSNLKKADLVIKSGTISRELAGGEFKDLWIAYGYTFKSQPAISVMPQDFGVYVRWQSDNIGNSEFKLSIQNTYSGSNIMSFNWWAIGY